MKYLGIFLLGFCFTYFINVLNLLSQVFEAKINLKIAKANSQIGEWLPSDNSNDYQIMSVYSDIYDEDLFDEDWDDID